MDTIIVKFVLPFLALIMLAVLVVTPFCIYADIATKNDLMRECEADGRKHYECVALLRSDREKTVRPAPIIIPHGR